MTTYVLRHYDTDVMSFDMGNHGSVLSISSVLVDEKYLHLIPLDMQISQVGIAEWLKNRTIPASRRYVQNFLGRLGLSEDDTKGIVDICRGLSLNDSYWVVPLGFEGTFSKHNLYNNRFDRTIAQTIFSGEGAYEKFSGSHKRFYSSPEFTTNGVLAKCWRRVDGNVMLYKAGSTGAANTGNEPYAEFYSHLVALAMSIESTEYQLSTWKNHLCSTCKLFTDEATAFIPYGRLLNAKNPSRLTRGSIQPVLNYAESLGHQYYDALADMLVFDAIVCNTDRHLGNFGVLIDSKNNVVLKPAPLFDHGMALFPFAMKDDLHSIDKYIASLRPALYEDFMSCAAEVATSRHRPMLQRLCDYSFQKNKRYNWDDARLKIMARTIQERSQTLLKMIDAP